MNDERYVIKYVTKTNNLTKEHKATFSEIIGALSFEKLLRDDEEVVKILYKNFNSLTEVAKHDS